MRWNPEQYGKFSQARLRPAIDLLARVALTDPRRICDLGCGTGNVTAVLAARWPRAEITGVDSSEAMLREARRALPGARWLQAGIGQWRPDASLDLVFSNAALHWLPDHDRLLPALAGYLAPGGVLAVQMPDNYTAPSHRAIGEAVQAGSWRGKLTPLLRPVPVAAPATYFEWLRGHVARIDIWQTEYLQVLEGEDPVKEFTKGTALRPFLDALEAAEAEAFEHAYADLVRAAYPPGPDGRTLFPFRRLFIVAERGS